jgi:hypothetical protein
MNAYDPHTLYELCVQSPRHIVSLLLGLHGENPLALREDFCGTAAVSARWIEEVRKYDQGARALALDLDEGALLHARERGMRLGDSLRIEQTDCITAEDSTGCDVVWVGNFSIGYIYTRAQLVQYLCYTRARLSAGNGGFGGGIFACDLYGGASAYTLGSLTRKHPGRGHETVHYHWSHDAADPLTGMVTNSISFKVEVAGEIVSEHPNAFIYTWRLWSLAELREALLEAGFTDVSLHTDINIAPGQRPTPLTDGTQLEKDWIAVICAR